MSFDLRVMTNPFYPLFSIVKSHDIPMFDGNIPMLFFHVAWCKLFFAKTPESAWTFAPGEGMMNDERFDIDI